MIEVSTFKLLESDLSILKKKYPTCTEKRGKLGRYAMKFSQPLKLNYRNVFEFIINVIVAVVSANRGKKNFSTPRTSFYINKKISFSAHRRQKHFDAIENWRIKTVAVNIQLFTFTECELL